MKYEVVGNLGHRTQYDDRDAVLRALAGEASASVKGMTSDAMTKNFATHLVADAESQAGLLISREFYGSTFRYGSNAGGCLSGIIGVTAKIE